MFLDWKLFRFHLIPPFSLLCNEDFTLALRVLPIPDPNVGLEDSSFERLRLVIIARVTSRECADIPRLFVFIFVNMTAWIREETVQPFHGLDTVGSWYTDQQISSFLQHLFRQDFPNRSQPIELPTLPI